MSPDQRMVDAARRGTRTLILVAALYVLIGLGVAAAAAMTGDRISAFLGFLIISAALAASVVVGSVLRLNARLGALNLGIDELRDRLERLEIAVSAGRSATAGPKSVMIDLASTGPGSADGLTAATLDRDSYPRMVRIMEEHPPAESSEQVRDGSMNGEEVADRNEAFTPAWDDQLAARVVDYAAAGSITTRNLLREWRVAVREADLETCRRVFSALVDTTSMTVVGPLSMELQALTSRIENRLRTAFTRSVREQDFAEALKVGNEMERLLPENSIVDEFRRLRPYLLKRIGRSAGPRFPRHAPAAP